MDKTNSKIVTLCFMIAAVLFGLMLNMLIGSLAGAFGFVARMADSDFIRHMLPALLGLSLFLVLQFNVKAQVWGDEVVSELRKVVFPSQKDTTLSTAVVIVMVLISSVIIASFDFISGWILNTILQ